MNRAAEDPWDETGGFVMGIKGIDHWVIVVADLERTLDFYRRFEFFTVYDSRA